ncbi:hypothetical protein B4U79_13950 [Dinothrombium tinctorium]|uniref:G-protein coupled receptors family 1 profile domain-containing protein n=1 Tax=Dinothrombium tinctorium TaxID=1965070 RepID=A0A3S3S7B4_9ACAR|nr:hypothetical protein B4U79_13950 [Dinothrombium tinctorium]
MEQLMYSWLSCCAIAPSVAALSVWVLFMFHIYRRHWTNVDLFLFVLTCQEILSSICAFAYSVVNVIRSQNDTSCNFVVWGITTVRVFQLSTLASLAIDRALILKWPYKYRFTVRQNQIKYHLAVLGCMSALVGTAAIIYGALILATILSFAYVVTNYKRSSSTSKSAARSNSRISSIGDLTLEHLGSTEAIAKFNTGSYCSLYGFPIQNRDESISRRSVNGQLRYNDLRWFSVLANTSLCYAVNDGPSLMFYVVAMIVPQFWSPVHDNALIWFSLVEGVLLPLCLYLTDVSFRDSVRLSFKRRSSSVYCSSSSLPKKESFLAASKLPFAKQYNEFVLIDKPYDTFMNHKSRSLTKCNTSTLNLLANDKQRFLHLGNQINHGSNIALHNSHNFQNDYFPYFRKAKILRQNSNLSQTFATKQQLQNRDELIYNPHQLQEQFQTTVNPFCVSHESQLHKLEEKNTLKKIGLQNQRIWRGNNGLWREENLSLPVDTRELSQADIGRITDHIYASFDQSEDEKKSVDSSNKQKKASENCQRSEDTDTYNAKFLSLDGFAVSASEDFEYRSAHNGKVIEEEGESNYTEVSEESNSDAEDENEDDETSIISTSSFSSLDNEPLYDNFNICLSRLSRNANECKRRGWQCFSASDLRLIDSTPSNQFMQSSLKTDADKNEAFVSRRTASETNLLQPAGDNRLLSIIQRDHNSSESVNSRSTNSSWIHSKLFDALQNRNNRLVYEKSALGECRDSVLKARRQLRYKKNVKKRHINEVISGDQKSNQRPN